eukprot:1413034-Amphidinium_carterae.1
MQFASEADGHPSITFTKRVPNKIRAVENKASKCDKDDNCNKTHKEFPRVYVGNGSCKSEKLGCNGNEKLIHKMYVGNR